MTFPEKIFAEKPTRERTLDSVFESGKLTLHGPSSAFLELQLDSIVLSGYYNEASVLTAKVIRKTPCEPHNHKF